MPAVLVLLAGGLLALQVVRTAAIPSSPNSVATTMWPGHPQVMLDQIMAEVGTRSARGEALPPALLARVGVVARKMPLAPEPFLINGAVAQLDGRDRLAEQLYLEARRLDPRSRAARYFLAERYLRDGRLAPALREMAILSHLAGAADSFAPGLANYARTPGSVGQLRAFFRTSPEYEPAVLSQLAADAGNRDLIFSLWSGRRRPAEGEAYPRWQAQIVAALIDQGEFGQAYSTWRRLSGVPGGLPGLFNPEFKKLAAPPPFNWSFGTIGGVAEAEAHGRLQVVYYGRQDAVLAEQMLMLAPGQYQLSMGLTGDLKQAEGVAWTIECLPQGSPILGLPVRRERSPARVQASFTVPSQCPAQRLRLAATPGEFPRTAEFSVGKLQLTWGPGK